MLLGGLAADCVPGDIVEGTVGAIMDWGAFVQARASEWAGAWRVGAPVPWDAFRAPAAATATLLLLLLTRSPTHTPRRRRRRRAVNGKPCPRAEAVLPLRELSYSWVGSPGEVIKSGQEIRCSVMYVSQDPPKVRSQGPC